MIHLDDARDVNVATVHEDNGYAVLTRALAQLVHSKKRSASVALARGTTKLLEARTQRAAD